MSITPFAYGDQPVRVVTINDEPWLVGTDVARCLGYANPTDALGRVHPDDKQTATLALSEGSRTVARDRTLVNESGMYLLVLGSTLASARTFQRWVTSEVLPQIRKTGSYSATPQLSEDQIVQQALAITAARVEKLTAQLAIAQPKADAFDRWLSSNVHYGVAEVAQALHDLGAHMGRNRLFVDMAARGWIYRDPRGDWRPYQAQIETGRLAVKLSRCENSRTGEEFAAHTVRITTKGAVALADLLGVAPADLANALDADNLAAA